MFGRICAILSLISASTALIFYVVKKQQPKKIRPPIDSGLIKKQQPKKIKPPIDSGLIMKLLSTTPLYTNPRYTDRIIILDEIWNLYLHDPSDIQSKRFVLRELQLIKEQNSPIDYDVWDIIIKKLRNHKC